MSTRNFNFEPEKMLDTHRIQETSLLKTDWKAIALEGDIIILRALDFFPIFFLWIFRGERNLDFGKRVFRANVKNL